MTVPTPQSRSIARAAAAAFMGVQRVRRYWDEPNQNHVDILSCEDTPCRGVRSYSTIGVSEAVLTHGDRPLEIRTEIVGACESRRSAFPLALATAAFCVLKSGWAIAPGVIFPEVLAVHDASKTMRHVLFLPPFLWDGRLEPMDVDGRTMTWLQAIPIAELELRYAEANGVPALELLFERAQIDVFDLDRSSVA